ncbi:MAG: hypothetical protein ACI9GH_000480 [Candidatus Paceibacteria bacterium]|jgi:hypothetical protein
MSTTRVIISHEGTLYEVSKEAFDDKPPFRLPDGTIFEVTGWSDDRPPKGKDCRTILSTYDGNDTVDLVEAV